MRRTLAFVCLALLAFAAMPFTAAAVAGAEPLSLAEKAASEFVTAFQKEEWPRVMAMADEAALSWVEYVAARQGATDGIRSIDRVESAVTGESVRAKVYYTNAEGYTRLRYVKLRLKGDKYVVVDNKMIGEDWISSLYKKGLFASAGIIGDVRLTVLGFLEAPPEVKIDMLVENTSSTETCYVYPSLEAFYMVAIDGGKWQRYFAELPAYVPESPLPPGGSMRTFAIFPYWTSDPALAGKQIKSLEWTLFVPYGPIDQFAIDYM